MPGEPLAKAILVTSESTQPQNSNQTSTPAGDFFPVYKVTQKFEKLDGSEKKMMVHFEFKGGNGPTETHQEKYKSFASILNYARKSGYRLVNQLPQEAGVVSCHEWRECCTNRTQEREIIAWLLKG